MSTKRESFMKIETIHAILKECGLSKSKAEVYLAALQVGTGTAQDIAANAGIPRTTAHEILQQLKNIGLVNFTTKGRTLFFTAEKPTKLQRILRDRERKIATVMPELLSLYKTQGSRPSVRVYEGSEGVKTVLEDTLTTTTKKLYGILSMADLYDVPGKEYMKEYVKRRVAQGITLQVVRSEGKEAESTWPTSEGELRELRYAPKDFVFPMTVYLYDHKVAIIGTEKETFGMIIESQDFHTTIKNFFDIMWQVSRVAKKVA